MSNRPNAESRSVNGGAHVWRNIVWNLAGVLIPLIAAALCAPVLLKTLGSARFGMLALAWTLIGYFSVFDLGLGRAVAKAVSHKLGANSRVEIAEIVWTAAITALFMGGLAGTLIWIWAEALIGLMPDLSAELYVEAVAALRALAIALPVVIVSPTLSGALEGYQRFDLVNLLRTPAGLINFLAPLAVIPFSTNLVYLVIVLGLCKLLVTFGYLVACRMVIDGMRQRMHWHRSQLAMLLEFGGWITLGNILNPIVVYTDRFLISAYVSITVVGYYVLPYEVLMRVLVPIVALTAVLFPVFSSGIERDSTLVRRYFGLSLKMVLFFAFPLTLLIAGLSHELLRWWLTVEAADAGHIVTKLFAIGIFVTCLNQVTLTLIQANGRPDFIPKLFLAELPIYLPVLIWSVKNFGIVGAASAWLARIFVDFGFLFWGTTGSAAYVRELANRLLPYLLLIFSCYALTFLPLSLALRLPLFVLCFAVVAVFGWMCVLEHEEKQLLLRTLKLKSS